MGEDLAEYVPAAPVALGLAELRGDLARDERLARYAWAARYATGRRVLDVGCDVGDGSMVLADADGSEVVGVDSRAAVVEAAQPAERPNLSFELSEPDHLSHPDASFDLVVCFEPIESAGDGEALLAELARVLCPDGVLAISLGRNPTLEARLVSRWEHVRLVREESWVGAAVLDGESLDGVQIRRGSSERHPPATASIALASAVELPAPAPVAAVSGTANAGEWLAGWEERRRELDEQRQQIQELTTMQAERGELRSRLIAAERNGERVLQLEADLEHAEWRYGRLRDERDALDQILRDITSSPSWRLTRPLRALKRKLGLG